jgi:hypothetical protein
MGHPNFKIKARATRPSLMTLGTLLVNVAQLIVGIIALGILIRNRK